MSLWHSPQVAESMKKLDGIMPPTFVLADDGKNGERGPPPSSCMEAGTTSGLVMRSFGFGCVRRHSAAPAGRSTRIARAAANARRNWRFALDQAHANRARAPRPAEAMWVQRIQRFARTLPAIVSQRPAASEM